MTGIADLFERHPPRPPLQPLPAEEAFLDAVLVYEITKRLAAVGDLPSLFLQLREVLQAHLDMEHLLLQLESPAGETFQFSAGPRSGTPFSLPRPGDCLPSPGAMAIPILHEGRSVGLLAITAPRSPARCRDLEGVLGTVAAMIGRHFLYPATSPGNRPLPDRCIANVLGMSPAMQEIFLEIRHAAVQRFPILLRGGKGTGKRTIAQAIHALSPQRANPFLSCDCSLVEEGKLEEALFGKAGVFRQARCGTVYLENVADLPPRTQTRLLRLLQEGSGDIPEGPSPAFPRLICSSPKNLEPLVMAGLYRVDLYYRLNVLTVQIPPLGERREDIPLLVDHFLDEYSRNASRNLSISSRALKTLLNCSWPGNVRELRNCVMQAALMAQGETITALPCRANHCLAREGNWPDAFPAGELRKTPLPRLPAATASTTAAAAEKTPEESAASIIGKEKVLRALERCGWVQAKAARMLGITQRQVWYAIKKHGIRVKHL